MSDAPNEGREEKERKWVKIVADRLEEHSKTVAGTIVKMDVQNGAETLRDLEAENRSLRDQLSKEREALSVEKHLVKVYKKQAETAHEAKDKEREMRKELVVQLGNILNEYDKNNLLIRVDRFEYLDSLVIRASELDKNIKDA